MINIWLVKNKKIYVKIKSWKILLEGNKCNKIYMEWYIENGIK